MSLLEIRLETGKQNVLYCGPNKLVERRELKWIEPPFYALYTPLDAKAIITIAFDHTQSRLFRTYVRLDKFALVQCVRCIINDRPRSPEVLYVHEMNDGDWLKRAAWAVPDTYWYIDQMPGVSVPAYRAAALKMVTPETLKKSDVHDDNNDLFYTIEGYHELGMGAYLRLPYQKGDAMCAFLEDTPTFILNEKLLTIVSGHLKNEPITSMRWELQTFACNLDGWQQDATLQCCEGMTWSISVERASIKEPWKEAQLQFGSALLSAPTHEFNQALELFKKNWNK